MASRLGLARWRSRSIRRRCRAGSTAAVIAGLLVLLGGLGCHRATEQSDTATLDQLALDEHSRQSLFQHALDNLNRLEQFQPQAMLQQIIEQLNQSVDWSRDVQWQPDPMLATLPKQVQQLPMFEGLEDRRLASFDAVHLQEVVTLRDVAQAAAGDTSNDLEKANRLFDWTVRNIEFPLDGELGVDDDGRPIEMRHVPYQTLFFGRGEPIDRAWTFILLARQAGLDAVLLSVAKSAGGPPQPWCVGVLIDNDLYLFDPSLGLPVPGPAGRGVATLGQAAEDESILRQLDLDDEHKYPLRTADVNAVTALVEASPGYLARRMKVLASRLTGQRELVLNCEPTAIANRVKTCPHVGAVGLWMLPLERRAMQASPDAVTAMQREILPYLIDLLPDEYKPVAAALQRGRILHLKGILAADESEPSANRFYRGARLADRDIDSAPLNPTQRMILQRAKDDASYWLGLVAFERGRYETAIDHFQKRTIDAGSQPSGSAPGRWTAGAYYNLGRAQEALGHAAEAAAAFEASPDPHQHFGNMLRARQTRQAQAK